MGKNKAGARRGGTSTQRSVGAYGSKRGTPDKQNARRRNREAQGRVKGSMQQVEQERQALEALLAHQAEHPAEGATMGAQIAEEKAQQQRRELAERQAWLEAERRELELEAAELDKIRQDAVARREHALSATYEWEGEPKPGKTIGHARKMLREGYTVQQVQRSTGVGMRWLDDIRIGPDHRAVEVS